MQETINRLRAKKGDEGFTLIELLVVVVIIGVLVAIAVPVYLNYRKGAADKSAQSDLRGAVSAIEQFYTDNSNSYPTSPTGVQSATFGLGGASGPKVTLSDRTRIVYVPSSATAPVLSYRICSTNDNGSEKFYYYDSTQGGAVKAVTHVNDTNFATCPVAP